MQAGLAAAFQPRISPTLSASKVRSSCTPGVYFVNDAEWAVSALPTFHRHSEGAVLARATRTCKSLELGLSTVNSKAVWHFLQVGDRYKLLQLLGSGSFSSVCSALDTVTGEQARVRQAWYIACKVVLVLAMLYASSAGSAICAWRQGQFKATVGS